MRDLPRADKAFPPAWNSLVLEVVEAYFETVSAYRDFVNAPDAELLMASSMRTDPRQMMPQLGRGQGASPYNYFFRDAQVEFMEGLSRLDQSSDGFCAQAVALWTTFQNASVSNMRAAAANYPRAAAQEATRWAVLADRSREFARRSLHLLRPLPEDILRANGGAGGPQAISQQVAASYKSSVALTIGSVANELVRIRLEYLVNEIPAGLAIIEADYPWGGPGVGRPCGQPEPPTMNLVEAIEAIVQAFQDAGEYDVKPVFDCELTLGPFSTTVTLDSKDGPNLTLSSDKNPWEWEGYSENERVGVDVTYSQDVNWNGTTGELELSLWAEATKGQGADYGAQLNAKVGVGYEKEGVGGVACYLLSGTARISMRALSERLTGR